MLFFAITALAAVLQKPPGPPSLPSVMSNGLGSLPLIGLGKAAGIGPPPHERMHQLADRFGDVMTLEMGREPWVILSSPEAVHEAFVVKGREFSGRPMVPSMSISSGKGQGFAKKTLDPALIQLRQKAFAELFDARSVQRAQEHFDAEIDEMINHLVHVSSSSETNGVEIRPVLRRAVTNMVLRYAFSARVPYEGEASLSTSSSSTTRRSAGTDLISCTSSSTFEELVDVVEHLWEELTSTQTFLTDLSVEPRLADMYYAGISPIPSLVKQRDSLIRTIVSQRRQAHQNEKTSSNDMLDVLLGASLPESDIMYTLVDLFVAGVNTVSTTLEWMLLLTADEPQYQTRARADAIAEGSSSARKGNNKSNHNDNRQPSYVDALIKETLRFKPPLLLPRRSIADTSIGNYKIPSGRIVLANNWSLTHDDRWWKKPEQFRPERWLEEEDRVFQGIESCKFIPYSIGRRACPGSRLAQAELLTATRGLLRSVSWSRVEPKIDLGEEYSLTLSPTESQSLSFHRLKTK